jgi:hypothetical protein
MRADAHYIDQLDAPAAISVQLIAVNAVDVADEAVSPAQALVDSIRQHGVVEPLIVQKRDRRYRVIAGRKRLAAAAAAGVREVPCIVRRVGDEEAQMLIAATQVGGPVVSPLPPSTLGSVDTEVANALASLVSSTTLLGDATPRLTRTVTVEMIRAELQRAIGTLRAASVLRFGVSESRRLTSPREIVQRVVEAVSADARLRGITVSSDTDAADGTRLNVDPELLSSGLSAVALTLCAALNHVDEAGLRIEAAAEPQGRVTLSVEQDFVVVPESWLTLPTAAVLEAPGGQQLIPLAALRVMAEASGGRLVTSRLPHGSRVAVELPTVSRP